MCDAGNRQLPLLLALLLSAGQAAADAPPTAAQELQAVRLLEAALQAGKSSAADWEKLRPIYRELLQKYPQDANIRTAFGDFLWSVQDGPGALREWQRAVQLDPRNVTALTQLAGGALAFGRPREALASYKQASAVQPGDASLHFRMGNLVFLFRHELPQAESDAYASALAHYAEAHRLAPTNLEFTRGYAETFYAVPHPDWATALRVWEEFYALTPNKDFARVNLARVRMKLGQPEEARACLAQVETPEFARLKERLTARIAEEFGAIGSSPMPKAGPDLPETSR